MKKLELVVDLKDSLRCNIKLCIACLSLFLYLCYCASIISLQIFSLFWFGNHESCGVCHFTAPLLFLREGCAMELEAREQVLNGHSIDFPEDSSL